MTAQPVTEHAPAKINLYLHVTGRREDGYHLLDSLIAFTDIGDDITIKPASGFSFSVTGPFAQALFHHDNLVVRAAHRLCERLGKAPDMHIILTKNLPVGAGIGGGSADAAAAMRGVLRFFKTDASVDDILRDLGADVPACFHSEPLRICGIGERIEKVTPFPALPVLLINPLAHCATPDVFRALRNVSHGDNMPRVQFENKDALFRYLETTRNDLTEAAITIVPEIKIILNALKETGASLVRMSGSGATCFALFDDQESCAKAAANIKTAHPAWWVQSGTIQGA